MRLGVLLAPALLLVFVTAGCGWAGGSPEPRESRSEPSFDWLGNTFPGERFNQVPHAAEDLAVAPDGVAATVAHWIESGHELRSYSARGRVLGARSGVHSRSGLRSVDVTNSYIYATNGLSLLRYNRAEVVGATDRGSAEKSKRLTVRRSGGGYLMGVAVCRGNAFVADPGGAIPDHGRTSPHSTTIKVVKADLSSGVRRAWRVPRARHLDCDRRGNVWVLQQRTATQRARLARYSPSGSALGSFEVSGAPLDIAADPTKNQVLVADNGRDQRVERYDLHGKLVGTIGVRHGYLAGPLPGLLGPRRFVGPRGVDVDAAGDVYVAQSGSPGYGDRAWVDFGPLLIVSKFRPDGTQVWRDEGLHFVAVGEPSADDQRFYTSFLSYSRGGRGRWRVRSFTVDPWAHPDDVRRRLSWEETPFVRDLDGRRYVFMMVGSKLRAYRVRGEILVPSTTISVGGGTNERIDVPERATGAPSDRIPDDCAPRDVFVQDNGDIWRLCQDRGGVWRYRLSGFTHAHDPVYRFSTTNVYPLPRQIEVGGRIEVHGADVYVSGWGPGEEDPRDVENWRWSGKRIVKFASRPTASGWPNPLWNREIHWGSGPNIPESRDKPVSWAVDSGVVAMGYQTNGDEATSQWPGQSYVRILNADNGSEIQVIQWPSAFGLAGWLDMRRPLSFRNGWVYVEDDHLSKIMAVCPSGLCRPRASRIQP